LPSSGSDRRRPGRDDAGVGIISSVVGFLVFACFLLLAVQVAFDLYARSTLGAVAADAARVVAGSDTGAGPGATAAAEADARRELGREGRVARFQWSVDADAVQVTISVPATRFLPERLTGAAGLAEVSNGARVRRERVR
jgi:hypothetical protein